MTPRVLIEPARLAGSQVLKCQTDERLVDLVRAGNDRAFEAIVDRYRRPLVRYCGRLLPPGRAEDAVQQAFLNAYADLRRDRKRIELRPWLYRIAHNAALNALRENGWSHERIEVAAHRQGGESAHEAAERRASLRSVLAAVQELPERQRDAVILRELEGRSYEQIAVELQATGGAVRQLLNRARHTLRAAATALTPAAILTRLPWGQGAPMIVSEAAAQDGLRIGAARIGGAIVASVAVAAGLSEGPSHVPSHRATAEPAGPPVHAHAARPSLLVGGAPGLGAVPQPEAIEAPRPIVRVHRPVRHVLHHRRAIPRVELPVAEPPRPEAPPAMAPRSVARAAPRAQQDEGPQQSGSGEERGQQRGGADSGSERAVAHAASHRDEGDNVDTEQQQRQRQSGDASGGGHDARSDSGAPRGGGGD
jgi:RNA polymerase sigma factor (sigma-70 family)